MASLEKSSEAEGTEVVLHKDALRPLARLIARHMLTSHSKQQREPKTTSSDSKFDGIDVENETKGE